MNRAFTLIFCLLVCPFAYAADDKPPTPVTGGHEMPADNDGGGAPKLTKVQTAFVEALERKHLARITTATPVDLKKIEQDILQNVTNSSLSTQERLELLVRYLSTRQGLEVQDATGKPFKHQLLSMSKLLGKGKLREAAQFIAGRLDPLKVKAAEQEAVMSMIRSVHKELNGPARNTAEGIKAAEVLKRAYRTRYVEEFKPGKEEKWAKGSEFSRPFTFVKLGKELADGSAIDSMLAYVKAFDKRYSKQNQPSQLARQPYLESIKMVGELLEFEPTDDVEVTEMKRQ